MAIDPLKRTIRRSGWDELDAKGIDAFLAEDSPAVLFFAGDTSKRPEADDIAVILPEIQKEFGGAFRVGVIGQEDGEELRTRFGVQFLPTLCLMRGAHTVSSLPRVRSWAEYRTHFQTFLVADTALDTDLENK